MHPQPHDARAHTHTHTRARAHTHTSQQVSWDSKLFALSPLSLTEQVGVDETPLLSAGVVLDADGVTTTYQGDFAVRKRATLLPGGYYGAVFSGVRLLNVTGGVKLNFTMTYPGGKTYETAVLTRSTQPNQPFSRVGLG
jgi:hypothetical protein